MEQRSSHEAESNLTKTHKSHHRPTPHAPSPGIELIQKNKEETLKKFAKDKKDWAEKERKKAVSKKFAEKVNKEGPQNPPMPFTPFTTDLSSILEED